MEKQFLEQHNVVALVFYLVRLYEFAEAFAVNNLNQQANLGRAKGKYSDGEAVQRLFFFRGRLVHKPFTVSEKDVIEFYSSKSKELTQLKRECGFSQVKAMNAF